MFCGCFPAGLIPANARHNLLHKQLVIICIIPQRRLKYNRLISPTGALLHIKRIVQQLFFYTVCIFVLWKKFCRIFRHMLGVKIGYHFVDALLLSNGRGRG